MSSYLLDTGILVGYIRGAEFAEYIEVKFAVSQPPNISLVSIVTLGEIYSLAMQLSWGAEKMEGLEKILAKLPIVDIHHPLILKRYAEVDCYSLNKHPEKRLPVGQTARPMNKNDLWIAATASVLNAILLTTDHDFDHLKGIFLNVAYIDQGLRREDAYGK